MDNTENGGTDKRSWRERLGIGTKDMPKISENFQAQPRPTVISTPSRASVPLVKTTAAPAPGAARQAPRTAPLAKPAPMAPRAPVKSAAIKSPSNNAKPTTSSTGIGTTLTPDGLANRLKAQREAAEKLAEQRIQVARQRAETAARTQMAANSSPQAKPKFSFVDEETRQARAKESVGSPPPPVRPQPTVRPPVQPVQMTPARPALGGERPPYTGYGVPPSAAPNYTPPPITPTQYQPQFRPVDPVTGYVPPAAPTRNYVPPSAPARPITRPADYPERQPVGDYGYSPKGRQRPLPAGQQQRPIAYGDPEDIFEQPMPGQRRSTAGDYRQAYNEAELGFDEPQRTSNMPWILLLMLLLAGAAAGAGYWYYQTNLKSQSASQQPAIVVEPAVTPQAPVVEADPTPVKIAPESTTTPTQSATTPAVSQPTKKQIYDRIVGDREVISGGAELAPSEQPPAEVPENSQLQNEPTGAPQPAAADPAIPDQGSGEAVPLPLPPPPGDTGQQGQATTPEPSSDLTQIEPAASESQAAELPVASVKTEPDQNAVEVEQVLPMPKDKLATQADTVVPPVQQTATLAVDPAEQVVTETVTEAPVAPSAKVVEKVKAPAAKPKAVAKKVQPSKPVKKQSKEPLVLVAPGGETGTSAAGDGVYGELPTETARDTASAAPELSPSTKRKRTLADLFKQDVTASNSTIEPVETPSAQPVRIAETPAKPAVQEQQVASTGKYVVQLASFQSRADANQEYARIKSRYGTTVVGLSPIVNESVVGGSTRFRLALGAIESRAAASQICSRLISAGERDCIVRRQ